MHIVIVEGPDGAGKTTLCERIIQEFPELKLWVDGCPRDQLAEEDPIARVWAAIRRELTPTEPEYVYDRLYFSELVYGKVLRGHAYGTYYDHAFIGNMLHALKVPIILCIPPMGVVEGNVKKKSQMAGVVENLNEIYGEYYGLSIPLRYNYKEDDPTLLLQEVQMSMFRRKARTW